MSKHSPPHPPTHADLMRLWTVFARFVRDHGGNRVSDDDAIEAGALAVERACAIVGTHPAACE